MLTNALYYGDNLDVLRKHIPEGAIDLIYLDPPFNSRADYNVLFREASGAASEAQIEAFEDTWKWGPTTAQAYDELQTGPHQKVARMLRAMVEGLGHNDMTAYLCMMAVRLVELHRVLAPTGSLYLHCDPTAGPYLRTLLDAVFGPTNFRSEIVWKRSYSHGSAKRYGPLHDTLLFFSKSDTYTWSDPRVEQDPDYIAKHFRAVEPQTGRRFQPISLTGAGVRHGDSGKPWMGVDPTAVGRHWALPGAIVNKLNIQGSTVQEKLDALDTLGMIHWPGKQGGTPRLRHYADELGRVALQDIWTDIRPISAQAKERLGYPTQKPLALLERIIQASSNQGDIVLDPFCGCGTAVHAAHKLGRRWIGIDVTYLAINLVERRMRDAFPSTGAVLSQSKGSGQAPDIRVQVVGEPGDLAGARDLAKRDKWQFQWWALTKLNAQPVAGKKKGADRGIDGVIPFFAGPKEDYKRAIVSVKGGENVNVGMVRDLVGVLDREKEPIGILLTLEPPTQPMVTEAASAGLYHSDFYTKDYPRIQILTVEEMLAGKRPNMPSTWGQAPFAKAPVERPVKQGELLR